MNHTKGSACSPRFSPHCYPFYRCQNFSSPVKGQLVSSGARRQPQFYLVPCSPNFNVFVSPLGRFMNNQLLSP